MGIYINPPKETKESYLERKGELTETPQSLPGEGRVAVCLVNNGAFTAAGIAFNERELRAFQEPGDYRPRSWYLVPADEDLKAVIRADEREWALVAAAAGTLP